MVVAGWTVVAADDVLDRLCQSSKGTDNVSGSFAPAFWASRANPAGTSHQECLRRLDQRRTSAGALGS